MFNRITFGLEKQQGCPRGWPDVGGQIEGTLKPPIHHESSIILTGLREGPQLDPMMPRDARSLYYFFDRCVVFPSPGLHERSRASRCMRGITSWCDYIALHRLLHSQQVRLFIKIILNSIVKLEFSYFSEFIYLHCNITANYKDNYNNTSLHKTWSLLGRS